LNNQWNLNGVTQKEQDWGCFVYIVCIIKLLLLFFSLSLCSLSCRCACALRDTINPYMLRRLKKNVKLDIPAMHEKVLFCCLTDYQYDIYTDYARGPAVQNVLKYGRMVRALGWMSLG